MPDVPSPNGLESGDRELALGNYEQRAIACERCGLTGDQLS